MVSLAAREELALDRLYFIPASESPFKPGAEPAPGPDRLRMLRLALAGQADCEVDDQEIRRGGVSYTIETAREYRRRFPEATLFYLVGADHAALLPKWREAETLAGLVEFVVIPRPGETLRPVPGPFRARSLRGFPLGLSSSAIRERVRVGLSVEGLVPAAVGEVIRNNRLYL